VILSFLGILIGLDVAFWMHKKVWRGRVNVVLKLVPNSLGVGGKESVKGKVSLKAVKTHWKARLAIVIDDFGYPSKSYPYFVKLDAPINISILPNHRLSSVIAVLAHRNGKEVLLHLPMQPYGRSHLEKNTIMKYMKKKQIERIVESDIDSIPYIEGVNNHMGSLITEDKRIMEIVLSIIKRKGLYFIDSRTSYRSIAYRLAKKLKLRAGYNSLFIDNRRDRDFTMDYILRAAMIALRKKRIIVIGHDCMSTFIAIRDMLPRLRRLGVKLSFASEVVH